jgi:hypothetical protein
MVHGSFFMVSIFDRRSTSRHFLTLDYQRSGRTDEFHSFSLICLAIKRRSDLSESGRADDGQTNSVLFD